MIMALDFEVILGLFELDPSVVMAKLCSTHPEILGNPDRSSGETPEEERSFRIKFRDMEFAYGHVSLWEHSLVSLENCVQDNVDAWRWCKPFTGESSFCQAFVYDKSYFKQQLIDDPEWFAYKGIPCPNLPRKMNVMGQTILDTSGNPGRRVIREGYVEFVCALMWLGRPFWKLSGANRKTVLAQPWLKCKEMPNDVLQVQAWNKPFTSAEGEEGEIQNRLRDLFFPNHAALDEAQKKTEPEMPIFDLNGFLEKFGNECDKKLKKKKR
jgi:hypothetical protein